MIHEETGMLSAYDYNILADGVTNATQAEQSEEVVAYIAARNKEL